LARWLNLPWPVVAIVGLLALSALFLYRHTPRVQSWTALALALSAGAFRLAFFQPVFDENHIPFYNDRSAPTKITGLVVDEPDIRDTYINLRVQVETIEYKEVLQPVQGLLLVRAPRYPERAYGDRLTVTGRLETPPIFDEFNYKDYLARFGIHSLIRRPRIELIKANQGQPFWMVLFIFKEGRT
jgi:competence protein ComEC